MAEPGKVKKFFYTVKVVVLVVVAVALLVFIWQNGTQQVSISLVLKTIDVPLPWVVLGSAATGAFLAWVGVLILRSRKKK